MIKWLYCAFLGHDLDKDKSRKIPMCKKYPNEMEVTFVDCYWCFRCKQYIDVR